MEPSAILDKPQQGSEIALATVSCHRGQRMLWLWAATLFTSASILFMVQPMVARTLLPCLGGTPTVWNTCMVFFQVVLLAGYTYAHLLSSQLSLRTQWLTHGGLICGAAFTLPIALPETAAAVQGSPEQPTWWLLKSLFITVGLPFFVVSSTGPLLQKWFGRSGHRAASDPYFLYSASNLGSLIALLGYPILIEPMLRLKQQSYLWSVGYGMFGLLILACVISLPRGLQGKALGVFQPASISWNHRLTWAALAFVPSSLMLGVTTYLTTDIASVPLLWVLPLAIYLVSFIIAFSRRAAEALPFACKALPIAVIALLFLLLTDTRNPAWLLVSLHLLFFFLAAFLCHTRLAEQRPGAAKLTEFYLWLSIGGALGGAFNALVAPAVFDRVVEYPLMIVIACLASGLSAPGDRYNRVLDWLGPVAIGGATGALAHWIPKLSLDAPQWTALIIFGLPLVATYFLSKRPVRFTLGLAAVMLGAECYTAIHGRVLLAERNFFGALRVTLDPGGHIRRFYHGTTVHGCQFIDPNRRQEPLAYYHRTGPFGIACEALRPRNGSVRVAAIGLGAGAVAAYSRPNERWTFYEIDPAVVRIASDTNYFTYLAEAKDAAFEYKVGDARLRLREAEPGGYGMIICDAFSSDVPPLHLMTREAMCLYLSKLAPNGAMLFHISSRYLDFGPVLASLADELALHSLEYDEAAVDAEAMRDGKYPSRWVVIVRARQDFRGLLSDPRWRAVHSPAGMRVWTDDFSNLLTILDWR